mmetsp:Transcript_25889/g.26302  ORF Transcript_25889/g.26302 Transcript_25889/m.26302 type:complete len:91 (+) Transcript_25889:38-310(+)
MVKVIVKKIDARMSVECVFRVLFELFQTFCSGISLTLATMIAVMHDSRYGIALGANGGMRILQPRRLKNRDLRYPSAGRMLVRIEDDWVG